MSENPNFEERLLNSYRDAFFKFKAENKGPENIWGDLSQLLLEAIEKNHELEKLKIELQQEKAKNLEISTSSEKRLQPKDAQISDLQDILKSVVSKIEEADLKFEETMEKLNMEGPETKNDKPDEESDRTATVEKQLQLKDAEIADLNTTLQSNQSYQENSKLKYSAVE
ncbi:unnamed protein product [Caenorhabditis nigoni]